MAEEKKKQKKPTAVKRILQNAKKNSTNSILKSRIRTSINNFESSIEKKEEKDIKAKKLNLVFSLIDKACKKNIFKKNKANRMKSQFARKM